MTTLLAVQIPIDRINDDIHQDWSDDGYIHLTASPRLGQDSIPITIVD